jgi:tight adherence protein C
MLLTQQELIFGVLLFATVALLAYALSGMVFSRDPLAKRLRASELPEGPSTGNATAASQRRSGREVVVPVMERIGHAAARPFMPKTAAKQTSLRKKLMHAGFYSASTMEMIVGVKVILLAAGLLAGYALGAAMGGMWTYVLLYLFGVIGFFLPSLWLSRKIKSRRRAIDSALPDALDLLVVCVESGLTLDAAVQRVGQEIALAHPEISKEFGITNMETRVGVSRIDALRNLGQRTGCASLQSLAAMLVQTERFGTSIAQALRVHGESLRIKRQHSAEEQAAKTTVKLAFPVVLFIFPTLMVVLGGPAFILFFKSPMFNKKAREQQSSLIYREHQEQSCKFEWA